MNYAQLPKFVVLAILDGWGLAAPSSGNAISRAQTPNINGFWASYVHTQLEASGEAVGLPHGEDGNTETGHLNLGAGRIVYQDLQRINLSVADGSFYQNQVLVGAIEHAKKTNGNLHLMGLVGSGGVHSNIEHMFALIDLVKRNNFNKLYLHLFTDGRDSPPTMGKTYVQQVKEVIRKKELGTIASIMGRYWAMDRDQRWERTDRAYAALTSGQGLKFNSPEEAIEYSYSEGKTDEFIEPSLFTDHARLPDGQGSPITISDGDSVIFFNFRIDRPRQLSWRFLKDANLKNLYFVTMTEYAKEMPEAGAKVAFPPEMVDMPLSRIISESGMRQLHAAESEKERFVTFYFNGQKETPFTAEERLIIPSQKVPTYDLKPEMSARELTDAVIARLGENHDIAFTVMNYANVDMVGHTGNIGAAVKACEVVDECIGKLANWTLAYDGALLITADHGNTEEMIDAKTGQIETEHSTNPVPFIAISKNLSMMAQTLPSGILADVAPTVLALLGLKAPTSMTGRNLLANVLA